MKTFTQDEIRAVGRVEANSLILGDCLEVLPYLADSSIDAIITDVPYG
jgi:DNA modification methylase